MGYKLQIKNYQYETIKEVKAVEETQKFSNKAT